MRLPVILLALLCLINLSHAGEVKHVDAAAAADLVKQGKVVVLDVRTAEEFADGHIKGAKNLDFFDESFKAEAAKLDPNSTYLVHCQSGGRSTSSLEALKEAGLKNLVHLDGGLSGWTAAGGATEK